MGFLDLFFLPFRRLRLFLPFFTVYFLKWVIWAGFLFYAVQWPLKIVLAPIILRFWGQVSIHYPGHIIWMYRILKSTDWVFDVVFAAVASFFLVRMVWEYISGEKERFSIFCFLLYVILNVVLFLLGTMAGPKVLIKYTSSPLSMLLFIFGLNLFLQTFFAYNLISIAVYGRFVSFLSGWRVLIRKWLPTIILIAIALGVFVPFMWWEPKFLRMPVLRQYPEFSLLYRGAIDILMVLVNTILHTVLTGWLYKEDQGWF